MWKYIITFLTLANCFLLLYLVLTKEPYFSQNELNIAYEATVEITIIDEDEKEVHGTGFVIDEDGLVITNKHVVVNVQSEIPYSDIKVFFPVFDLILNATVVYQSEEDDIAFLQIDTEYKLNKLDLGDTKDITIGESIFCVGNVQGTGLAFYFGNIASNIRIVEYGDESVMAIQMDLNIFPGMSGSPILNTSGDVVGIASFRIIEQDSTPAEGMNFSIPSDTIQNNLDAYLDIIN